MKNLNYHWRKKADYPPPFKPGIKVFGTFVCGGGSTMGYKLAGCEHLGGVEIDKKMGEIYRTNHDPKYFFLEDIRLFNERIDIPEELYNLDILDGSPPCTPFSMAGKREEGWGKKKMFTEGQAKQTLDDLVYVYCDTIEKLMPKVAILENVPGLLAGRAKKYAIGIYDRLRKIGYDVQIFVLNGATMGLPQARDRVFYVARRRDLKLPKLKLSYNFPIVPFGNIVERGGKSGELWPSIKVRWPFVERGDQNMKFADKKYRNRMNCNAFFSSNILYDNEVPATLTSSGTTIYFEEARRVTDLELKLMSSFPVDFDFCGKDIRYVCGMSVPPLMTARLANSIIEQWFYKNP